MGIYLDQISQNEIKNLFALLKNKQFTELVSLGEKLLLNFKNSAVIHNFLGIPYACSTLRSLVVPS